MIAVIFEVEPHTDHRDDYFRLAGELRTELETIDGFISVERFESIAKPGKFLSLSFWHDEDAIRRWRAFPAHGSAQREGRANLFAGYRLRVAAVVRDYGLSDRAQAPDITA